MGSESRSSGDFFGLFFLREQADGNRDDPDLSGGVCWATLVIKTRTIYGSTAQLKDCEWL